MFIYFVIIKINIYIERKSDEFIDEKLLKLICNMTNISIID